MLAVIMCVLTLCGCEKTTNSGGKPTDEEVIEIIKSRYAELTEVCAMTVWYEDETEIESDITVYIQSGVCYCLVDDIFLERHEVLSKLLNGNISYDGVKNSLLSLFSSFSFYTSRELLRCFAEIDGELWFVACDSENPHPQFINNYFDTKLLEIDSITEDKISFSLGHELFAKEGKNVRVPLELVKNSSGEWVFNETLLNISVYAGSLNK